jgi:prevent-host-death family protein
MRKVNSTDFKTHFDEFVDLVRDGPIEVLQAGKPVGVFLSPEEYGHFRRLDDAYWVAKARAAEESGEFLSHEESMKLLTDLLNRAE